jgi:hypothetical protein
LAETCEQCGAIGATVSLSGELLCDNCLDDNSFFEAWERAEAEAVDLLQRALPELRDEPPPAGELEDAVLQLRAGIKGKRWPYRHMSRAAGFHLVQPMSSLELWLGAVGGLIAMREESGLDGESEASLMALQHADWLGAVVGLVRAGVGASAEPQALVGYINRSPEIEGELDYDDAGAVESAFELILPAWEAAGAVDGNRRLTALGRWGLPRALAWAWNGEFGPLSSGRERVAPSWGRPAADPGPGPIPTPHGLRRDEDCRITRKVSSGGEVSARTKRR